MSIPYPDRCRELHQKLHTVMRLYEKLRRLHNAVGDIVSHRITLREFKDKYGPAIQKHPKLARRLRLILETDAEYITWEQWQWFLSEFFDPLHDRIVRERVLLQRKIFLLSDEELNNLVALGILLKRDETDDFFRLKSRFKLNRSNLNNKVADYEMELEELL